MGPFRIDSAICRAAFIAGVIGDKGGDATLISEPSEPEFVPFGLVMQRAFCFEGEHPAPNPVNQTSFMLHALQPLASAPSLYSKCKFRCSILFIMAEGSLGPGLV
jgi:hypothetical protein